MEPLETDTYYTMYGLYQSPYGHLYTTKVKDVIENAIHENATDANVNEFISKSSAITKGLKVLENELGGKVRNAEPQTVGGSGALFRVKRKGAIYRGKYM